MPKMLSLYLRNFKGARAVDIDLSVRSIAPVITLIGLNESGKTTILEGISNFVRSDSSISRLFSGAHSRGTVSDFMPVHRKAAFTGIVQVGANFLPEQQDLNEIGELCNQQGFDPDLRILSQQFSVTSDYSYEDSIFDKRTNFWSFDLSVKKGKSKKILQNLYDYPEDTKEHKLWLDTTNVFERRMPALVYFPTFLVDLPKVIYLQEHSDETAVNRYYRQLLQEILDTLDEGLSVQKHVVDRISDFHKANPIAAWISSFLGSSPRSYVDSVFQKISAAITREVLGSWSKVFQRPSGARSVIMDWNIDVSRGEMPYVSFFVSDGESKYALNERSLGFRWFFSFLLFTAFKQKTKRPVLFLFDEPAANLHARAQAELLKSFEKLTSGDNKIIFSTHSHHMINPRWLSSAYIIENGAIDYDQEDMGHLNTKPTEIKATPYRQFASTYPSRTTYFQPVIEALEYVTPEVVGAGPFLIVEGISDFYALRYVKLKFKERFDQLSIMPGSGAGASGPLISYLIGRGDKFLVLLDDDKAGKKAAENYREGWFLTKQSVVTVGELDKSLVGKRLEDLLSDDLKASIRDKIGANNQLSKKEIGLFLAEQCASATPEFEFDQKTFNTMEQIILLVQEKIS